MGSLVDLTGKKFGRLTVIKRSYSNREKRRAKWLCKCDCGKEKIIRGYSLRSGHTRSCGCLQKDTVANIGKKGLPFGLANMREIMRGYKKQAKERGLEFSLTQKQFEEITQKDCYYCGAKPNNIWKNTKCNGNFIYNGIDRIDSNKGYTIDNIVSCCKICNYAKRNLTLEEFQSWIERIYNKIKKERQVK